MTTTQLEATNDDLTSRLAEINAIIALKTADAAGLKRRYLLQQINTAVSYLEALPPPAATPPATREQYYRDLMTLHRFYLVEYPEQGSFRPLLLSRYGVEECRLMTVEQVRDFRDYLRSLLRLEPIKTSP